jgi:hypothetical protein
MIHSAGTSSLPGAARAAATATRPKPVHSTVVFLGPSLRRHEAEQILAADFRPPAARGDIYSLIATGIKTIVLIDGVFHSAPSIWPREILDALGEGIEVLGASSMGALRAAELHRFGMVGHGTIFQWYRDGAIDGDDEVALWHGPEEMDYCTLSEPLVNIRATLGNAARDGCLTNDQVRELLDYSKRAHYPERSYPNLLECPASKRWSERDRTTLRRYIATKTVDQKRADAIGVLRLCRGRGLPEATAHATPCIRNEGVWQLDRVLQTGFEGPWGTLPGETLLTRAKCDSDLLASMRPILSARGFVLDLAKQEGISIADDLLDLHIEQWGKDREIDARPEWLRANGLTFRHYRRLLAERILVDRLAVEGSRFARPPGGSESPPPVGLIPLDQGKCMLRAMLGLRAREALSEKDIAELPPPRLLVDWARRNGISCPDDVLVTYTARWAPPRSSGAPVPRHSNAPSDAVDGCDGPVAQCALAAWMIEKTPCHFGVDWSFELALLGELQITGLAARLLETVLPT